MINPTISHLFRRGLPRLVLATMGVAASGGAALKAASPLQADGSWEKTACPFDSSKALLSVTCGRLKVPENYDLSKGRAIDIAVMIIRPQRNIDPGSPVIFLSGGPGSPSLVFAERLVTTPGILETVVDRDWVFFDQRGGGRSTPALSAIAYISAKVARPSLQLE